MNRQHTHTTLGLVLCMTLVLASLTACQSEPNASTSAKRSATAGEHPAITILTGHQNYAAFAELMNEKYPEVNLEFVSYAGGDTSSYMWTGLQKGDIPDIFAMTYVPDGELQKQHLLDLSTYSVVNRYATTTLDSLNVGGAIYMIPSRYALLGIVYNKTLLEENGWAVPTSFQELKALAPVIRAAGYEPVNMNARLTGTMFGMFFGLGNTGFFGTPAGAQWKTDFLKGQAKAEGSLEEVAAYFQQWIDEGFISTYYYDNPDASVNDDFDSRKYVFQLYSNRTTPSTGSDEYGFMPILSSDGSNNMLVRLVSRYYGLNKQLGEPGNEQKLEDALKVFDLMATEEGQNALSGASTNYISSTSINNLPEGSPYADVLPLINSGNMVDMVYGGWENHIVPLIETYGNPWAQGKITAEDFLCGMDTLNASLIADRGNDAYAIANENISIEAAARLCAIAQGKAAGADAALVSMPAFHGFQNNKNLENAQGVHAGIYEGPITQMSLSIFAPGSGSIQTLTLTGKEINALAQAGFTVEDDPTPYPYYMATKGNQPLEDDREYLLAISDKELSSADLLSKAKDTDIDVRQSIVDYITALGSVTEQAIAWEE